MSPGRLLFLYPPLIRPLLAEGAIFRAPKRHHRNPPNVACISTAKPLEEGFVKRHGKAVEPTPIIHVPPPQDLLQEPALVTETTSQSSVEPKPKPKPKAISSEDPASATELESSTAGGKSQKGDAGPEPAVEDKKANEDTLESGPMETVLQASTDSQEVLSKPAAATAKDNRKPLPTFIHHFDTYAIVKELESGGFTYPQSITSMKAIRFLLARHILDAKDILVSKSDVENESYLFRAACSELSTEVTNNRKSANEEMRQQRAMLQHEADILGQTLNQELNSLDDTVKSMFNERKMAVQEEQTELQTAIQELSLKISAKLNSDVKSDIEGVRWEIMRMAAAGIGFVAVVALGMSQYVSNTRKAKKAEKERKKRQEEDLRRNDRRVDSAPPPDAAEILAAN